MTYDSTGGKEGTDRRSTLVWGGWVERTPEEESKVETHRRGELWRGVETGRLLLSMGSKLKGF